MLFRSSLSVSWEYLALPGGPGRFRQDSSCPALLRIPLKSNSITCTRLSLSAVCLSKHFQFLVTRITQSYNPNIAVTTLVWAPSISLAATLEIDVSFFSSSYLDVSVQRVCSPCGVIVLLTIGLPHSDIRGSNLVCKSPRLIAAYHVLLRLQEPRHPPYALTYFLSIANYRLLMIVNAISSSIMSMNYAICRLLRATCGFAPLRL